MSFDLPRTIRASEADDSNADHRVLVLIGLDAVTTVPLPREGELTIGRSPENAVCIEDGQISRVHARVHLGANVEIEDLGSANGTRIEHEPLPAGERRTITSGAVIEVGSTLLVYQARARPLSSKRLWSHTYFEARLEEECQRGSASAVRTPLAVLRVHLAGAVPREELEEALTRELRPGDLVASYAELEFELLLLDTPQSRADRIAQKIREQLDAEIGIAVFPAHGVSAQALIAHASEAVRGSEPGPIAAAVIIADGHMRELYRIVDRIAAGSISVLLLGETGVGKEVIAEAIHARSPRRAATFVKINCAALSESLFEAELFGYEKGAFTGAEQPKAGLMETAHGGTIFLDEVGELPPQAQAKLLRAIEQREVLRVGAVKARAVDVRVVSATNRNLEEQIKAGRFRSDLYFRLNGVTLEVPPLRKRRAEIEPLARMFVERSSRQLGLEPMSIAPGTLELIAHYAWPGNIRELRNVMERAVLLASEGEIAPIHLPFEKLSTRWTPAVEGNLTEEERALRERIVAALEQNAGNQTRAADQLGFSRQTLSKWLDRFDIPRPKKGGGST